MPNWTREEEMTLTFMVQKGKPIEEICKHFNRSQEAMRMKIHRLGLTVPAENKVTTSTTTTRVKSIKPAKEIPSAEEAVKLWYGAVDRLNQSGLSLLEVKRLRLLLSALKQYVTNILPAYEKYVELEKRLEKLEGSIKAHYEMQLVKAETGEERERIKKIIERLEEGERGEEK